MDLGELQGLPPLMGLLPARPLVPTPNGRRYTEFNIRYSGVHYGASSFCSTTMVTFCELTIFPNILDILFLQMCTQSANRGKSV